MAPKASPRIEAYRKTKGIFGIRYIDCIDRVRGKKLQSQSPSIEHFDPMLCSYVLSYSYSASRYSYSYSKRPSVAIRPIGPQGTANRLDQRSASPQFKQPSSTSTVSLSTSTSTRKSGPMHVREPIRET
jgi:hypothetical protein